MSTTTSKPTGSRESSRESTHSGRLLLRMPRALHAQLAARSDESGLSLNQYIVETLTRALEGGDETSSHAQRPPRSLRLALLANAVVVALAAATCVALLVFAWR